MKSPITGQSLLFPAPGQLPEQVKRFPRFRYGRRDLRLSLREHFLEQVTIYNDAVFDTDLTHAAGAGDVFAIPAGDDLVYLDPPYVPRSDDNCYVKRYHFLEGLACYWEGKEILAETKVKKLAKPYTPFSCRSASLDAFDRLFRHFADSTLVLSYSSNAYPDLATLREMMARYKHAVEEYLIIGTS